MVSQLSSNHQYMPNLANYFTLVDYTRQSLTCAKQKKKYGNSPEYNGIQSHAIIQQLRGKEIEEDRENRRLLKHETP